MVYIVGEGMVEQWDGDEERDWSSSSTEETWDINIAFKFEVTFPIPR